MLHGDGPIPAKVMVVGEAFGERDEAAGLPFQGTSGVELNKLLSEAGIMRTEVYLTNVVNACPPNNDLSAWVAMKKKDITPSHVSLRDKWVLPCIRLGYDQLLSEIKLVSPNLIIAVGGLALWALTGKSGILRWRGSQLRTDPFTGLGVNVIPTIHPAAVLREWSLRPIVATDFKRAKRFIHKPVYDNIPNWQFTIRPSFEAVQSRLRSLTTALDYGELEWIDFDYETKQNNIDCIGLSWSATEALCIPFMSATNKEGYWSLEEETMIVWLLYKLLTHKRVKVRGQNLLYDCQYSYRYWHFIPRVAQDTMISQHVAFAGMRKALDFQASLYCDYYVQWKPDKEQWKEGG